MYYCAVLTLASVRTGDFFWALPSQRSCLCISRHPSPGGGGGNCTGGGAGGNWAGGWLGTCCENCGGGGGNWKPVPMGTGGLGIAAGGAAAATGAGGSGGGGGGIVRCAFSLPTPDPPTTPYQETQYNDKSQGGKRIVLHAQDSWVMPLSGFAPQLPRLCLPPPPASPPASLHCCLSFPHLKSQHSAHDPLSESTSVPSP